MPLARPGAWPRAAARTRPGPRRRSRRRRRRCAVAQRAARAVEQRAGDVLVEPATTIATRIPDPSTSSSRRGVLTHGRPPPARPGRRRVSTCGRPACSTSPASTNPSPCIVRCEPMLSTSVKHTSSSRPSDSRAKSTTARPASVASPSRQRADGDRVQQLDAARARRCPCRAARPSRPARRSRGRARIQVPKPLRSQWSPSCVSSIGADPRRVTRTAEGRVTSGSANIASEERLVRRRSPGARRGGRS